MDFGSGIAVFIVTNPLGAKVYSAPFDSAAVYGTAPYGEQFTMLQKFQSEGWVNQITSCAPIVMKLAG